MLTSEREHTSGLPKQRDESQSIFQEELTRRHVFANLHGSLPHHYGILLRSCAPRCFTTYMISHISELGG
jgi:hypothetical protein